MSANEINPQIDLNKSGDPFFFFHIPKTAGSTLVDIMEAYFSYQEICPAYYTYELNNFTSEHLNQFRFFRGHIDYHVLGRFLAKKVQTITFLRHPIEHTLSIFSHLKRKTDPEFLENEIAAVRQMSLEKFIFEPDRVINLDYSNLQLRTLIANSDLDLWVTRAPALTGVPVVQLPGSQDLLAYGKQLLSEFLFVGLAERFEDGLFLLCYIFGVRPLEFVPYINVSFNKPAKKEIAPEIYEQIAWKNRLDFELHRFGQQLFEERFASMIADLLEHYGTARQRQVYLGEGRDEKRPVPREVIYELLEKHYRHRFTRRHQAVSSLFYNAEQPLNGRNWHKRENFTDDGICRWTGPGKISTIDFPLAAEGDLKICFEVVMALVEENLDSVKLFIEDEPVALSCRITPTGTRLYEGVLPRSCLERGQGLARLNFEVSKPVVVNELDPNSPDEREVGVVIKWIEVAPLNA